MCSRKNSVLVIALAAAAVLVGMSGVAQATLIGYWNLDENSGATSALDTGGVYNYNLTPTAYGTGAVAPTAGYASGAIGKAWQFYGTGTAISKTVGTSSTLQVKNAVDLDGMTNLTLSAWIWVDPSSPTATTGSPPLGVTPGLIRAFAWGSDGFGGGVTGPDVYQLITTNPVSGVTFAYPIQARVDAKTGAISPSNQYPSDSYATIGQWTLVTFSSVGVSGGAQTLYRNGVQKAVNTAAAAVQNKADNCFSISGVAAYRGASVTGYVDDVGVWNEVLSGPKVGALYFAPHTFTAEAALGYYGQLNMQDLFKTYDLPAHPTTTINGLTWQYVASGLPGTLNTLTQAGTVSGQYYIRLDASGGGVVTIPEPSTLALLAAGLLGLLCYAWRKRK